MRITASQIGIFWDYENCRPPPIIPGSKLVANIRRRVQLFDPIKLFKAYVDLSLESTNPKSVTLHSELQSSGVALVHCPHNGGKDVVDKMMIVDMLTFAMDTPPPATIAIITGDRDFAYAAAVLKLRGYRIVIIAPSWAYPGLKMQADELFDWQRDVTGTDDQTRSTANSCESANVSAVDEQSQRHLAPPPKEASPTPVSLTPPKVNADNPPHKTESNSELSQTSHKPANLTSSSMLGITRTEDSTKHATSTTTLPANPPNGALDRVLTSRHGFEGACTLDLESDEEEDDDGCACTICTRSTGVIRPSRGSTNKTADVAIQDSLPKVPPDSNVISVDPGSKTVIPSSVPSNVSSTNTAEALSILPDRKMWTTDLMQILLRFLPLIVCFIKQRDQLGTKRLRASGVASAMLKMKPNAYQIAGVTGMKQYVEQARQAEVVLPAQGNEGDDWIELNPAFDDLNCDLTQKEQSVTPGVRVETPEHALPPHSSCVSSTTTNSTASPSVGSKQETQPLRYPLTGRFLPLIHCFIEQDQASCTTRLRSSVVASAMLKSDPNVYKKAGVTGMKQFIEEARLANVLLPSKGDENDEWIEINPNCDGFDFKASGKKRDQAQAVNSKPTTSGAKITVDPIFKPLVERLQAESPSYQVERTVLGTFLKEKHPDLYNRAGVSRLKGYLGMAEKQGIVAPHDNVWVKLVPALYQG